MGRFVADSPLIRIRDLPNRRSGIPSAPTPFGGDAPSRWREDYFTWTNLPAALTAGVEAVPAKLQRQ